MRDEAFKNNNRKKESMHKVFLWVDSKTLTGVIVVFEEDSYEIQQEKSEIAQYGKK